MDDKHGSDFKIENLDAGELKDLVWELREEILKRIKTLSRDWAKIHEVQRRRDRAEDRLSEMGVCLGYSKVRYWKKEEGDEAEEE